RWAQDVPTQPFESLALPRPHDEIRVQIETIDARVTPPLGGRLGRLARRTEPHGPPPPPSAERCHAPDRRRGQPRQDGRLVRPAINRLDPVVTVSMPQAPEPTTDERPDRRQHPFNVQRGQVPGRVKSQRPPLVPGEDAIE